MSKSHLVSGSRQTVRLSQKFSKKKKKKKKEQNALSALIRELINDGQSNYGPRSADYGSDPARGQLPLVSACRRCDDHSVIGSLLVRPRGPELARGRAQDPRNLHGAALLAVLPRRDIDRPVLQVALMIVYVYIVCLLIFYVLRMTLRGALDLVGPTNFLWLRNTIARERGIVAYRAWLPLERIGPPSN